MKDEAMIGGDRKRYKGGFGGENIVIKIYSPKLTTKQ